MIRVLQVFGRMDRGGAETMIMNIYRNIDRSKIQFDFVVHTQDKCDYDDEIHALGGRIFSVPRFNLQNTPFYKKAWKRLLNNHHEWKIVHGHIMSVASIYLKLASDYDMMTISHSHIAGKKKGIIPFIKSVLEKKIDADYYMSCSIAAGLWLFGKEIVDSKRFFLLPNAINLDKFTFDPIIRKKTREELKINSELLIGHVGRFDEQKNHSFLLKIFKEIVKKDNNAKLLLVGRGECEEAIKEQVKWLKLQDSVIFAGVRTDTERLLQAMDVFVFPSLFEGLPVTLVEAQATGIPTFISNNVSKESVIVDDLVTIKSLNDSALNWAEHIVNRSLENRHSREDDVRRKGYDIQQTSKWLEEFYLEKSK